MTNPLPINRIAMFPKIQADTAVAVFLLKRFGESFFPGISKAEIVFWTQVDDGKSPEAYEKEGTLLIDLGGSRFDHHRDDHGKKVECASSLIAKYLSVENRPELRKLLMWAKRDDLEGKGTVSEDPLDRAFGLSGIIMTMNRTYSSNPATTLDFVIGVIEAHVYDEWRRAVEMPAEWQSIKKSGKSFETVVPSPLGNLRLVALESDNTALPGFLRAYFKVDIIIQRVSSGHTNVVTRQQRRADLRKVVECIRVLEAQRKNLTIDGLNSETLQKPGRVEGLDEWFYDTAANSIQNGGVNPQNTVPTRLKLDEIVACLKKGLTPTIPQTKDAPQ